MNGFEIVFHYISQAVDRFLDPYFYLFTSWLLFWVFSVSGVAKLKDPHGAAQAIANFGITSTSANSMGGLVLGAGEVGLAAGLALAPVRGYAIVGASILLLLFSMLLARSLARRETFSCSCFGKSSAPISYKTFLRTGVLAALAILAAAMHTSAVVPVPDELVASALGLASVGIFALVGPIRMLFGDPLAHVGGRP